jgi:hypothetical protein
LHRTTSNCYLSFEEIGMDEVKAAAIVAALSDGVNPSTGELFPADSPYQSADVVRALYVARRALEIRGASRTRSEGPPNAGKPWSAEHDQQLLAEFDQGRTLQELASMLGRTIAGVQVRLVKYGRASPDHAVAGAPRWRRSAARPES